MINLPIGIAVFAVSWKMIPFVRHDFSTKKPDLIGSVMVILTIGAISFGLLNGHTWGWGDGRIIASWVVAVVAAVGFVISTRRAAVPVIDPQLFKSRVFTAANVSVVIAATIFGMQLLGMSLFLQQAWHWSTTDTGLAIASGPLAIVMSSFVAQKLNEKLLVGLVVASGSGIIAAGQILMLLSPPPPPPPPPPRPPGRWCLWHRHPGRDPRQGSHDRRPDAVLPPVVGSGRRLRRCRRDLPRPHPPSPGRGGDGDCRSAPSGSPRAVTETVAGRLPPGGRPLVVTPAKRPGRAPNATEKRWTPVPGSPMTIPVFKGPSNRCKTPSAGK